MGQHCPNFFIERDALASRPIPILGMEDVPRRPACPDTWDRGCLKATRLGHRDASGTSYPNTWDGTPSRSRETSHQELNP